MQIKTVDVDTLKSWVDQDEAILVDVREPDEYATGSIQSATLLPLGNITYNALPERGGKKLVIYCRSGKRSAMACDKILTEQPTLDVYNLEGGILAWHAAGF